MKGMKKMKGMRNCILATAISLALASAASAQSKPDFSGTWTMDAAHSSSAGGGRGGARGAGGGMGGGLGMGPPPAELRIKQDAKSLKIDQKGAPVSTLVYRLDGVEAKGKWPAPGGATRPATFRSEWKDGRLVTMIVTKSAKGEAVSFQDVRYIDSEGFLIAEISISGQENLRRTAYKRKK
jgi:hypothetical protein